MRRQDGKLRIGGLIFGSLSRIGGYQVFTYNLLKRLSHRGHHVELFVPLEDLVAHRSFYGRMPFGVRPLLMKAPLLAEHAPGILGAHLLWQTLIRRYDAWQIVGAYPAGYVASYLRGRVPLVLRTHGDDIQKDERLGYGLRLDPRLEGLITKTCHRMDRLVALTESIAVCYRELAVPDDRIVEIPNGVDIGRLARQSNPNSTRQKWNLPLDRPVILTVGRYHPKKGYAIIPSVAGILKRKGISFLWLIVGNGTDQLNPLIEEAGVAHEVRTVEEIGAADAFEAGGLDLPDQSLVDLYQCSDIFVFPSHVEGFPRVLIEAMAAGLPVVTTDAPGCRDVIQNGSTGLLADPDDAEGLAAHVGRLIEDRALRARLVEKGTRHISQYDWDAVVDTYERLYRSLVRPAALIGNARHLRHAR